MSVQQITGLLALEAEKDHSTINSPSRVLHGVDGGDGGAIPSQPHGAHGFCATTADPSMRGQYSVHRMGERHRVSRLSLNWRVS